MENQATQPVLQLPPPINLSQILQEQMIVNSFFGILPTCYSNDIFDELDEMLQEDQ